MINEQTYLETYSIEIHKSYNENYGHNKVCECSHDYYRHFDSYENMDSVGYKYCSCDEFEEKKNIIS